MIDVIMKDREVKTYAGIQIDNEFVAKCYPAGLSGRNYEEVPISDIDGLLPEGCEKFYRMEDIMTVRKERMEAISGNRFTRWLRRTGRRNRERV